MQDKAEMRKHCVPFVEPQLLKQTKRVIKRLLRKREDAGDAQAMFSLGSHYSHGLHGLPQDHEQEHLELYRLGRTELGHTTSCYNIGCCYLDGNAAESKEMMKKADALLRAGSHERMIHMQGTILVLWKVTKAIRKEH